MKLLITCLSWLVAAFGVSRSLQAEGYYPGLPGPGQRQSPFQGSLIDGSISRNPYYGRLHSGGIGEEFSPSGLPRIEIPKAEVTIAPRYPEPTFNETAALPIFSGMRRQNFLHKIPASPAAGCGNQIIRSAEQLRTQYERLHNEGGISKLELVNIWMYYVEVAACAGLYSVQEYCDKQSEYLKWIEQIPKEWLSQQLASQLTENKLALVKRCRP